MSDDKQTENTNTSNKRPIQQEEIHIDSRKRQHFQPPPPEGPPPAVGPRKNEQAEPLKQSTYQKIFSHQIQLPDRQIKMRLLVSGKEAGVVIGQKGMHVNMLRDMFDFKVSVSPSVPGAPDRVVCFEGELSKFGQAIEFMAEKLASEKPGNGSRSNTPEPERKVTLRFLVPGSRLGYIIGKGGSRIKELQANSGAHIFSQDQELPNSTEKVMTMIGDSEELQIAAFSLASLIGNEHENINGPPQVLFDPAYRPAHSYGAGSTYGRNSQYGVPAPSYGTPSAPPPGQPGLTFQAPVLQPEQQQAIAYYYNQMQQMCAQYPEMASQYQKQYQDYYAQMTAAVPAIPAGPTVVQEISFPNQFVGCVIGKGGSFIREIKHASTSDVRVADPVEGSDERIASVSGTAEGNKIAIQMIMNKVEMEKNRQEKHPRNIIKK